VPAVVIDNTAQVRLTWGNGGTAFAINVVHGIRKDPLDSINAAKAQSLANAVASRLGAMTVQNKAQIKSTISLLQVGIRDLNTANQPEHIATPSPGFSFTSTEELLPLNVASCITLRTAKAGASYRGRFYMTGFTEGTSSNGVMHQYARDASVAIVGAVRNALDDSGLIMSVASRKTGRSEAVTSWTRRDTRWDTQRRRIVPGV
jgi:hypothetical protein